MKIIGISSHRSGVHDNSAVLMKDGKILFAEAEERVSRVKHDGRFPYLALKEALKATNTKLEDIDYFVSGNPEGRFIRNLLETFKFLPKVGFFNFVFHVINRFVYKVERNPEGNRPKTFQEAKLPEEKLVKISHYLAHAASAYFSSSFDKCLVISMDGYGPGENGEPLSGQIYLGESDDLEFLEDVPIWGSMGLYYGAVTKALGFKLNDGEGKTMGLAAYGDSKKCYKEMKSFFPRFVKNNWTIQPTILDILNIQRKGVFEKTKTMKLLSFLVKKYGKEHVAAACQRVFEEEVTKYIRYLVKKYKQNRLVLAGGIFLNVIVNMKLLKEKFVDDIFVYPNPSDGGIAMGAAMVGYMKRGMMKREELIHPAFGREYSNTEILKVLRKSKKISYRKVSKGLTKAVAKMLTQGQVVGWFQGRDEWGPRALGQRSVLADPRKIETKERINNILKKRDWFMPFAPSMLVERAEDYLKVLRKAPFMIIGDDVKAKKRKEMQAAIHIDFTARPHLVTKKANPLYHGVIKEFEKLTGVGTILNTSFNRHGLPIVYSPKDAVEHLLWEAIDALVIGNYVVERKRKK